MTFPATLEEMPPGRAHGVSGPEMTLPQAGPDGAALRWGWLGSCPAAERSLERRRSGPRRWEDAAGADSGSTQSPGQAVLPQDPSVVGCWTGQRPGRGGGFPWAGVSWLGVGQSHGGASLSTCAPGLAPTRTAADPGGWEMGVPTARRDLTRTLGSAQGRLAGGGSPAPGDLLHGHRMAAVRLAQPVPDAGSSVGLQTRLHRPSWLSPARTSGMAWAGDDDVFEAGGAGCASPAGRAAGDPDVPPDPGPGLMAPSIPHPTGAAPRQAEGILGLLTTVDLGAAGAGAAGQSQPRPSPRGQPCLPAAAADPIEARVGRRLGEAVLASMRTSAQDAGVGYGAGTGEHAAGCGLTSQASWRAGAGWALEAAFLSPTLSQTRASRVSFVPVRPG